MIASFTSTDSQARKAANKSSSKVRILTCIRVDTLVRLQESSRITEEQLREQIRQLTQAAKDREASIGEKVQTTAQEVDAALVQLQDTTQALTDTKAEKEAQAEELSKSHP